MGDRRRPRRDTGASVSALSFARQVGRTMGAAASGAIFASRLAAEFVSRLPADAPYARAAVVAGNPARSERSEDAHA
ncbi:MAG: hypothetical protein M3Q49_08775 [Actinomycetota bacterium]|nr:hypothetical protein [Actinomycetota bacterium]